MGELDCSHYCVVLFQNPWFVFTSKRDMSVVFHETRPQVHSGQENQLARLGVLRSGHV